MLRSLDHFSSHFIDSRAVKNSIDWKGFPLNLRGKRGMWNRLDESCYGYYRKGNLTISVQLTFPHGDGLDTTDPTELILNMRGWVPETESTLHKVMQWINPGSESKPPYTLPLSLDPQIMMPEGWLQWPNSGCLLLAWPPPFPKPHNSLLHPVLYEKSQIIILPEMASFLPQYLCPAGSLILFRESET